MIITIHQPDFLPWLGFFDRWAKADLLIFLDDVQYIRRGWQNRDKILGPQGTQWLTVPVIKKGNYYQKISEVKISYETNWIEKHLKTMEQVYRKAPGFKKYISQLSSIYHTKPEYLMELNTKLLEWIAAELKISTPTLYSSEHRLNSTSTQRLVDLVLLEKGTTYLSGTGSKEYLEEKSFSRQGIEVVWQDYNQPNYQQFGSTFVKNLSVLDYLFFNKPSISDHKGLL